MWRILLLAAATSACLPPHCQCPEEGVMSCSGGGLRLLRSMCGARLRAFQLRHAADLASLPDNLFFRLRGLKSIAISESPDLESVGSLLGLELSLEQLSVRNCRLQQRVQLGRLQALRSLDLSYNQLQRPPAPLPPSLQALFLRGNRISSLEGLSSLPSLIQLDLSENRLVSLSLPTPRLIFLTLSRNLLEELSEGVFEASGGNLRRVDLSDNRLSRLPGGVWSAIWGDLQRLDLTGNPLECGEEWVEGLRPPENLYGFNCKISMALPS